MFAAEFEKRLGIGRKFRRSFATEFFDDTRVIEDGIPYKIGPEDFQERGSTA
jgi:hypothetical protein